MFRGGRPLGLGELQAAERSFDRACVSGPGHPQSSFGKGNIFIGHPEGRREGSFGPTPFGTRGFLWKVPAKLDWQERELRFWLG